MAFTFQINNSLKFKHDEKLLAYIKYIVPEDREEKILENQTVLKQPIVRNGQKATVGYMPDIWKTWD